MSLEKEKRNRELLEKLDNYLENISPDALFREIEGRCPGGQTLEEFFEQGKKLTYIP